MARLEIDVPDEEVALWKQEAESLGLPLDDLVRLRMNVEMHVGEAVSAVMENKQLLEQLRRAVSDPPVDSP